MHPNSNAPLHPRVSVVMAVYNAEGYLRDAVESILNQSFPDFELIVVDDGSTDGTWVIMKGYNDARIRLLHNRENLGLSKSLNKGLVASQGKYVARQDADDVSLPDRLAFQVSFLDGNLEVGLLGTAYHVMNRNGHVAATFRQPEEDMEIRWQMLFHNAFCHSSVIFRRDLIEMGNLFYDECLSCSQDYELWERMLTRTKAANLDTPLVFWRKNDHSISAIRHDEQQRSATRISARQIERLIPGISVSFEEVEALRRWFYAFPNRLEKKDIPLCRKLVHILEAFAREPNKDCASVREIAKDWTDRIVGALSPGQLSDHNTRRLLKSLLDLYPIAVVSYLPRRVLRNLRAIAAS
jgi:glycosyltransferase involved in cell wall biosynthesis